MTDSPSGQPGASDSDAWEQMLRSLFGDDSEGILAEMRARGFSPEQISAASGIADNPAALGAALDQIRRMLGSDDASPVNTTVAHDVARHVASSEGDPTVTEVDRHRVKEAFTVAELWLDAVTDLPPAGGTVAAWSRAEWVEATLATWNALTAPVATAVVGALTDLLASQSDEDGEPEHIPGADLFGPGATSDVVLHRVGSAVFGMQVGQATGTLAREVFGTTDVGVPLLAGPGTALVVHNVDDFAEGLDDIPVDEVRLFLAMREAASSRLFTHVPWLRSHVTGLVDAYARGVVIDPDELERAMRDVDPTDTAAMQRALSSGVFGINATGTQQATLLRLETTLALFEGWVDAVVAEAAAPHLPHVVQLREMMRRRRAAGGPAEQTFATLVGLELRPRRAREATRLWELLRVKRGSEGRDAVWDHPDFLPTAEDLDDADAYVARRGDVASGEEDVDAALEEIFAEAFGDGGGATPEGAEGENAVDDGRAPGKASGDDDVSGDGASGDTDAP